MPPNPLDLEALCQRRELPTRELVPSNTLYGHDLILKRYAGLPEDFVIPGVIEHAVSRNDGPMNHELAAHIGCGFTFSRRMRAAWRRQARGIRAHVIGACGLYLRRLHGIERARQPSGTVAFPGHSTEFITAHCDFEAYAESLVELPEPYQPVRVCMYWRDVELGRHRVFQRHGLSCVSAGHIYDPRFLERLYAILRDAAFTTSNVIGTYSFYAVELGVPFFLLGPSATCENDGRDPNRPKGVYVVQSDYLDQARRCFAERRTSVSEPQRAFVSAAVGADDLRPPIELRRLFRRERLLDHLWPCRPPQRRWRSDQVPLPWALRRWYWRRRQVQFRRARSGKRVVLG